MIPTELEGSSTPKNLENQGSTSSRDFSEAPEHEYDLLIIGGGIVGTGIARDASMRGLSVILFEKEDLSSGTSSKSSRLIHGGLRYLDTYDFNLVRKDLREREILLHLAPHLVGPLRFLIPNYLPGWFQKVRLRLGMMLYDLFSLGKSLPSHRMLSKTQIARLEPSLNTQGLQGGASFYDCQAAFIERFCVENAIDARDHGAKIFNHAAVVDITKTDSRVTGVVAKDQFSGQSFTFRSKITVNAGGPWADGIKSLAKREGKENLRRTKGIHIAIPKIASNAIAFYAKSDGRLLFAIPWLEYTLVGTTDTDFSRDPNEARSETKEIEYLLREVGTLYNVAKVQKIEFTYAGVRPLVRSTRKTESAVSRNYKILDHEFEGLNGLISVLGVKLTSHRVAAKDVVDLVSRKLNRPTRCTTAIENLPGGKRIGEYSTFVSAQVPRLARYGFDEPQITYFLGNYGSRVEKLLKLVEEEKALSKKICPRNPQILAEIALAMRSEFALTVSDFMLRRVPIVFTDCQGLDCVGTVSAYMGKELGWNKERAQSEVETYEKNIHFRFQSSD